jgi:hypothetical protein
MIKWLSRLNAFLSYAAKIPRPLGDNKNIGVRKE